jgi:hypothetical protein
MKVKSLDGELFEGAGPDEICYHLWHSMLNPDKTIELWMKGIAQRTKIWNGATVRYDNSLNCFEDLLKAGIIKRLADDYEITDQCKDCYWNEADCTPGCDPCKGFLTEAEYNERKRTGYYDEEDL